MDELENITQKCDWGYGGNTGRTLEGEEVVLLLLLTFDVTYAVTSFGFTDVWNSRSILGNDSNGESLLDAFQNNKRIVSQYFNMASVGGRRSAVADNTVEDFMKMWNDITSDDTNMMPAMKPFLIPDTSKMVYSRTFRCSKRAIEYIGPSLEQEFFQAQNAEHMLDPSAVGDMIVKLANRKDCMVLLAFKSFHGKKSSYGNALVIDCIPVLETLGPDFQEGDFEISSSAEFSRLMDLFKVPRDDPEQFQQARNEMRETFTFKLMKTYLDMPHCPPPSVLSKKLVEIPSLFHAAKEGDEVAEETLKLPYGAAALSRIDSKFLAELIEIYVTSRVGEWMKLRPWLCDVCGKAAANLVFHAGTSLSPDAKIDEPLRGFLFPVCSDKKCSLLQRQLIDQAVESHGLTERTVKYCEHCRKHEPTDGPLFSKCSRCHTVTYCSKECQRAHWQQQHKKVCKAPPKF